MSLHDCVVALLQVLTTSLTHAQVNAAGLQLAVIVFGLPSVPVVGPVTVHTGGAVTTQVSVLAPGLPPKV